MSFVEKWKNLENKAKKYLHFTLILAVLNVFLLILTAYSFTKQKIIIQLPPVRLTESIAISSNEVSQSFFKIWGRFFISTLGNYTPESIDDNVYIIASSAFPESAVQIKADMDELAKHVKENRIKQSFYPNWKEAGLEIRANYARMTVPGEAVREIGTSREDYEIEYELKMAVIDGHMYLTEISKKIEKKR